MKHFIVTATCMLLGSYTFFGQCTFNGGTDKYCIGDINITYQQNRFVISGFNVNPGFTLQNHDGEPAIAIFIETGDGNFISEKFYPAADSNIEIYYEYPALNTQYQFIAEATKNYDGGGPRRRILPMQTAIQSRTIPDTIQSYHMPGFQNFTVQSFPNDIVQDDTITLVVVTDSIHYDSLYLHYDNRLVAQFVFGNNFQKIGGTTSDGTYRIQKFSVSGYGAGNNIRNTFIRLKPDAHFVSGIPMNTDAPPFYITTNGDISKPLSVNSFKVLSSHDPNSITVSFCDYCLHRNCPTVSRRTIKNRPITLHYTINFENTGPNNEDSVRITYYCRLKHLKEEVKISNPVFGDTIYNPPFSPVSTNLIIRPASESLQSPDQTGTASHLFSGCLRGTSRLPYGHLLTQGSINFTVESKEKFKDISPQDRITAWAEITFVSAGETIKTNEINTSRRDFRKYYNRRCICQKTFILFRWICRIFKGL